MKALSSLAALTLLLAGPALAQPTAPSMPAQPCVRWSWQLTATNKLCPPTKAPAADPAWQAQQASRYCRMEKDLRLVGGTVLAQQGQMLELGTTRVTWGASDPMAAFYGGFEQLIRPCTLAQRQAMAEANAAMVLSYAPYSLGGPSTGGPVLVRSHTRCNSSKCWPVSSYWRAR